MPPDPARRPHSRRTTVSWAVNAAVGHDARNLVFQNGDLASIVLWLCSSAFDVHRHLEASMSRTIGSTHAVAAVAVMGLLAAAPARAQQSVTLTAGQFALNGYDSRIDRDVLLENLNVFAFRLDDFNGGSVGGSWDLELGDHFEISLGLGYYQRTVPSVYNDYVDIDGSEITQDFRLRIVPGTATMRFLPFGDAPVQPYFGGGVGLYAWRYAEFGKFIDFSGIDRLGTFDTFTDRFVARGTDVGGIVLGGVRFPFADRYAFGIEVQYHEVSGVVGIDNGFLDDEIDLGGLTTQATFQVGF